MGPDALTGAGDNGFVARLALDGTVAWARALSGSAVDEVRDVAALPDGGVVVVGSTASADFAAGSLAMPGTDADGFVIAFAPDGTPRWGKRLSGVGGSEVWSVTVGHYKNEPVVIVGGNFTGGMAFGTQSLSATSLDLFVGLLSFEGAERFAQAIGGAGAEGRAEVGAGGHRILLAGEFAEVVGLGSASFSSAGGSDVLLVQIAP
jgi:hypothetical protein